MLGLKVLLRPLVLWSVLNGTQNKLKQRWMCVRVPDPEQQQSNSTEQSNAEQRQGTNFNYSVDSSTIELKTTVVDK